MGRRGGVARSDRPRAMTEDLSVVIELLPAPRVVEKKRIDARCSDGCGHRICADCTGGHYQKVVGDDGLCQQCRRWRAMYGPPPPFIPLWQWEGREPDDEEGKVAI